MHQALKYLSVRPEFVIVDGNRFKPFGSIGYETIVNGDEKYLSIAAASILAKTFRDDYMKRIHRFYPCYLWEKNKGYATEEHRLAIRKNGVTRFHRKSFHPNVEQLTFDF
jgi:ribonuclease HII